MESIKVCQHMFQHVIEKGIQYCVDCDKILWGSGQNGEIRKNDQKVANQHRC